MNKFSISENKFLNLPILGILVFLCINSSVGQKGENKGLSLFSKKNNTETSDSNSDSSDSTNALPKDTNDYTNYAGKDENVLLDEYRTSTDDIDKNGLPIYDAEKLNKGLAGGSTSGLPTAGSGDSDKEASDAQQKKPEAAKDDSVPDDETIPGTLNTIFKGVESKLPESVKGHANTIRNIWTAVGPSAKKFFASAMTLADKFGADQKSKDILGTVGQLIFGIKSNTDAAKKGSLILKGFTGLSQSVLEVVGGIRERLNKKFDDSKSGDKVVDKTNTPSS